MNVLNSVFGLVRDLGTCAAVCRNWVPRSRSLQFKTINFGPPWTVDRLHRFLDLLPSAHVTIIPHVLEITVAFEVHRWELWDEAIIQRLASLRALQSVIFTEALVPQTPPMVEAIANTLRSLPNLVSLALIDIPFESFVPLQHIVAACRGLERLYIHRIQEVNEEEEEEEEEEEDEDDEEAEEEEDNEDEQEQGDDEDFYTPNPLTIMPHVHANIVAGEKEDGDDEDFFTPNPSTVTPRTQENIVTPSPPPLPCAPLQLLSAVAVACSFNKQLLEWVGMPASSHQLASLCIHFDTTLYISKTCGELIRDLGSTLRSLCIVNWPIIHGGRRASATELCI